MCIRDRYYADLSPVVGSEQGGKRPVLIIQNDTGNLHSPTVIALSLIHIFRNGRACDVCVKNSAFVVASLHHRCEHGGNYGFTNAALAGDNADDVLDVRILVGSVMLRLTGGAVCRAG